MFILKFEHIYFFALILIIFYHSKIIDAANILTFLFFLISIFFSFLHHVLLKTGKEKQETLFGEMFLWETFAQWSRKCKMWAKLLRRWCWSSNTSKLQNLMKSSCCMSILGFFGSMLSNLQLKLYFKHALSNRALKLWLLVENACNFVYFRDF